MNLVSANLFSLWVFAPLVLTDNMVDSPLQPLCILVTFVGTVTGATSMMAQLLIGVDQYMAVIDPLHYHRRVNKKKCFAVSAATWVVGIVFGVLSITDFHEGLSHPEIYNLCESDREPHLNEIIATFFTFSVVFVLPTLCLTFIYSRIFCAARKNSIRTRRNSASSMTFEAVGQGAGQFCANGYLRADSYAPGTPRISPRASRSPSIKSTGSNVFRFTSNLRQSMKHRLSNASALFMYREEGRAAKVTILVVFMVLLCWTPFFAVRIVRVFTDQVIPKWVNSIGSLGGLLNTVLSPVLYAYRSKRVQRDLRRLLGRRRQNKINAKVKRMKSFSCPQLLISSHNEPTVRPRIGVTMTPTLGMKSCRSSFDIKSKRILPPFHRRWVKDDENCNSTGQEDFNETSPMYSEVARASISSASSGHRPTFAIYDSDVVL